MKVRHIIILILIINQSIFGINIKRLVRVNNEKVYLSDVVDFDSEKQQEKAMDIQLTYSPKAGEEKTLNGIYLKAKLLQFNIDEREYNEIPEIIIILREYQVIQKSEIKKAINNLIKSKYNLNKVVYDIDFEMEDKMNLPLGNKEIAFNNTRLDGINLGNINFTIEIKIDNIINTRIFVKIKIGEKIKKMVLNRDVIRDELFSEDLVIYEDSVIYQKSSSNTQIVENILELENNVFKRNMKSGSELKKSDFMKEKLFKRNDNVILFIANKGIIIKSTGKALENGYKGENVKIMNKKSRKILFGEVMEDGTVKIIN